MTNKDSRRLIISDGLAIEIGNNKKMTWSQPLKDNVLYRLSNKYNKTSSLKIKGKKMSKSGPPLL
jgi:hypothetical protein